MLFVSHHQPWPFSFPFPFYFGAIVFTLSLVIDGNEAALVLPNNVTIPAIFFFGDSTMDTGNNHNLKTVAKGNFLPYGRDFEGGPTGRFSNGKVLSDIIAEGFGIKDLMPAYLDPKLQLQDLLTGVSFASSATGYDPITAQLTNVLTMSDQLHLFKQYIKKIKSVVGEEKAALIISKSIYIIGAGSNDVANTYFLTPIRRKHYDFNSNTDFIAGYASKFLQELYGLGARRIGLMGLPPIGCVPSQRTIGGGANRDCYEAENELARLYNDKLSGVIDSLKKLFTHPDTKLIIYDTYNPLLSLIKNPTKYGFEVVNQGCCGTGLLEASIFCNPHSIPLSCEDASKYIFWDSYHPSEKAYKILTYLIIKMHFN